MATAARAGGGGGSGQHEHGLTVGDVVRYGVGGIGAGVGGLNGINGINGISGINGIGQLDRAAGGQQPPAGNGRGGRGCDLNPAQTAALLTAIAAGLTDVSELTSSQMLTLRKTQAAANEATAPDDAGDAASDPCGRPRATTAI